MIARRSHTLLAGAACLAIAWPSAVRADTAITVDGGARRQAIAGFGVTYVPLIYGGVGDVLTPSQRERAVDALFNQARVRTGDLTTFFEAPSSSTLETFFGAQANDNGDPADLDPDGFYYGYAETLRTGLVDVAGARFDLYPGVRVNVRWASQWLAEIRESDYDRYLEECAEQVLAGITWWQETYGEEPRYAHLFNEPTSGNQELGTPPARPASEVVDIARRAGARLRAAGFEDVMFVAPGEETEQKSLDVARALLEDPEARLYVGAIAYHPYPYGSAYSYVPRILEDSGSGSPDAAAIAVRGELRDLAAEYGLPLWMTEVSHGFFREDGVSVSDFRMLRGRAIHIHDEFVHADASAFFAMNAIWDTVSQAMHFGTDGSELPFDEHDTIVHIYQATDEVIVTGAGHAVGHYARWVEPGAVRLEATTDNPLVQATAFLDDKAGRLVLVVINNQPADDDITVSLAGLAQVSGEVVGEQSTESAYWQAIDPFTPTSPSTIGWTAPAMSVTSLAAGVGEAGRDGGTSDGSTTDGTDGAADDMRGAGNGCGCRLGAEPRTVQPWAAVLLSLALALLPGLRARRAARRASHGAAGFTSGAARRDGGRFTPPGSARRA